jgi:hypothetical protein
MAAPNGAAVGFISVVFGFSKQTISTIGKTFTLRDESFDSQLFLS